eukprot:1158315-Pelagomonas_calceolata.AAC.2
MEEGAEMDSPLQTVHLYLLKCILGQHIPHLTGLLCGDMDISPNDTGCEVRGMLMPWQHGEHMDK